LPENPDFGDILRLQSLNVQLSWDDVEVKFERVAGRFSTMADLVINEVFIIFNY